MLVNLLVWLSLVHFARGSPPLLGGKIFGGQLELIRDYPFLVNLRRGGHFRCGGSIITPTCVLTAAHCLERRQGLVDDLTVHAQQQCLNDPVPEEHVRRVWYASLSQKYCPKYGFDSDIAVLRLSRPFDISGRAALVGVDFNELPARANLTIVGWGITGDRMPFNDNQCLQAAQVHLVTQQECLRTIGKLSPITGNMLCAIGDNASDACAGDSGGPIIYEQRLAGLVSWGYGCGSGLPGVYTKLSSPEMTTFLKYFIQRHC